MHTTGNVRVLDQMVADGLITAEQRETVHSATQLGERLEEALLDLGIVDEATLLKYLASHLRTRFVSTEKLARADIEPRILGKVPQKFADQHAIFPVMYEAKEDVLSVVTADPDDLAALQELQLVSGAKQVRAYLARPRSVRAAIAKAYHGDIHAFANIDRAAHEQFATMLNIYERHLVTEESMATALATEVVGKERVLSSDDLSGSPRVEAGGEATTSEAYLETLNVLVSLLEHSRPDLRGHSAQVARLMKKLADRLGLSSMRRATLMIAGYIHDLGKSGTFHLTALNVADYEGHRTSARRLHRSPLRIMETVALPQESLDAVKGMYERHDGQGLPDGIPGKDVPLAARLLAIADTYADLTQNPRNPLRKRLRPVEACDVLSTYRGTVFDPNLVDLFRHTVTGEDLKARLLAQRHRVLVLDSDPEESAVLELRLVEQGFEVEQARTVEQGFKALVRGDTALVICELLLGDKDGLGLLAEVRRQPWGEGIVWIVLAQRATREDAQRAFELGAADLMDKPISPDILVTKAKQLLEKQVGRSGSRGVSGSLQEMSLPDIVQVLWHGRKSGALKVRAKGETGEIHFVDGNIYNALWATLRGEEAFYGMLELTEGEFSLDPAAKVDHQVITASPEALLLEGMRRMDEAGR